MRILLRSIAASLLLGFAAPVTVSALAPAKDPHHVMWTNKNGKAKCMNKGSRAKADKCADRLRQRNATNVQVMAGRCHAM